MCGCIACQSQAKQSRCYEWSHMSRQWLAPYLTVFACFLGVLCWKNKEIKMTEGKKGACTFSASGYYKNTARSSVLKCINALKL